MGARSDENKISAYNSRQRPGTDVEAARRYCRNLARGHYENFIVGSILVPRKYMPHLHAIYAFCRYSDDLADEVGDPLWSRELLAEWRGELKLCYDGHPSHPVMIALQETVNRFEIPSKPFEDLISAFEQDCVVSRYATYPELLDYCTRSANPVGRVFLWLFGYHDEERLALSDHICTGLQLANFWQDVTRDFDRGRVYIPEEDLITFGCAEVDIQSKRFSEDFRELMRFEVDRAGELFRIGGELSKSLPRRLAMDVELFRRGGTAVLRHIRHNGYDILSRRPVVSKLEQVGLFLKCLTNTGV